MTNALRTEHRAGESPSCAVIRGNRGSADHLRQIDELIESGIAPHQRHWLIDDRDAQDALSLPVLDHFVMRAKRHGRGLEDMAVAWVSPAPWSLSRQCLANQLPFRFRRFVHLDEARRWLGRSA